MCRAFVRTGWEEWHMVLRLRAALPDISGVTEWVNQEVSNDDFTGQPVLVHFWSVSCELCKMGFKELNKLREEHPQVEFIGIHVPRSEKDTDVDAVKGTIVKYELKHPQGIDNRHAVVDAFENEYVPAFYLFDAKGQLRHRFGGARALSMLKRPLERMSGEIE